MNNNTPKLADLHQHLYGSIHWQDFLQFLKARSVDWTSYQAAFQDAYGDIPPIGRGLEGCMNGGSEFEAEFRNLFVFGDEDGGNFPRFQAKYNMLAAGSAWSTFSRGNMALLEVAAEISHFMRQILERQLREGLSYSEQRMTLNPRFTQGQARELLLSPNPPMRGVKARQVGMRELQGRWRGLHGDDVTRQRVFSSRAGL